MKKTREILAQDAGTREEFINVYLCQKRGGFHTSPTLNSRADATKEAKESAKLGYTRVKLLVNKVTTISTISTETV